MTNVSHSSYSTKTDKPAPTDEDVFISKIKGLLESEEEKNLEIAFQLLAGLSDWQTLAGFCVGLAWLHPSQMIREKAAYFVQTKLSKEVQAWYETYAPNIPKDELESSVFLENIQKNTHLNIQDLTTLLIRHKKLGVKYAIEEDILPPKEVLMMLINGAEWLSLENKHLKVLPPEIGDFTQLHTLNISGNDFTQLPTEICQLKNLDMLYFSRTPLSRYTLKQLQQDFPHIFAKKYYMKAISYLDERNYHDALQSIDKSLKLNPHSGNALHAKGLVFQKTDCIEESIKWFEKALTLCGQDPQIWASLTLSFLEIEEAEKAVEAAQEGIKMLTQHRQSNTNWLDILYLYKGQAFALLGRFEEAHKSLDQSLKKNPDTGAVWYQKARTFAMQSEPLEVRNCLQKAIQLNRRFLREANQEKIFRPFRQELQAIFIR